MNPGNLVGLTILVAFTGCGMVAGRAAFGEPGGLPGAIAGALVWFGLAIRASRAFVPPCLCGNAEADGYETVKTAPRLTRFRCRKCGKTYQIRRGLWCVVEVDGELSPMMRRGRAGRWLPLS